MEVSMADTSKYKSISIKLDTYNKLKHISKNLVDIDLSYSQTIANLTEITYQQLKDSNYVQPLRGDSKYQAYKKKLMNGVSFQVVK
tara:strand:+ start:175 stop:432 length:258 start_codon:yes stop_codon:yes gene_type:complete